MSFYKGIYMEQFVMALKEFQTVAKRDTEVLLEDFLSERIKEEIERNNYEAFRETCKKLCSVGSYSSIINFMYGVFSSGSTYNLAKLKEILDTVKVRNDIKLSDICADFYLYVQKLTVFYQQYGIYNFDFDTIDLYRGDAEKYFVPDGYPPFKIPKVISEYILNRLFDLDVNIDNITSQDIDYIVAESVRIKTLEIEKENEYTEEHNRIQEEHEKQGKMNIPRYVPEKATEFKKNLEVTGLLLDIFRRAAANGNEDTVYYIQTKYLWPIMNTVPWKQQDIVEVQLMGIMLESYLRSIYDFEVFRNLDVYARLETDNNYSETDFLNEMVNDKPGLLSAPAIEFGKKNRQLGRLMATVIYSARDTLKKFLPDYLYSFMLAIVPYFLYFNGYCDEASEFLIKNYNQLNSESKQKFFLQMTIAKCILSGKNLQKINILYGFFIGELNRLDLVKNEILAVTGEIVQYIKDVKEYLYLSHDYTIKTQRPWHDIVFGGGSITEDLKSAEKLLAQNKLLPEPLFSRLMTYVEAFCNPSGIKLDKLGLPRQDNDDKLRDALSFELISRGRGIMSSIEEYAVYYLSLHQLKLRQSIDVFLQRHISRLMDEAIEETIEKIKLIKTEFIKHKVRPGADLSDTGNNTEIDMEAVLESETENILKQFDEVYNELARKLENRYIGREDVELYIDKLQMDFIKKYSLGVPGNNLISKLPYEERKNCSNFLVTSEIVYRMLCRREDHKKLDFSPALIPLTKALELVLNIVFQKMPLIESAFDENSRKYYFYQAKKKESIELGPCINLLKDSRRIYVNDNGYGRYVLKWGRRFIDGQSRFLMMGGEEVLRCSKLSVFKGLELYIQPDATDQQDEDEQSKVPPIKVAFKENADYNRMLLIKGLEYVKNNYRNVVAHKDEISPEEVATCRSILIQSENLLWILLYILN